MKCVPSTSSAWKKKLPKVCGGRARVSPIALAFGALDDDLVCWSLIRIVLGRTQSTGKERVLCLTAERRAKKTGYKGVLHSCKQTHGKYQVSL